MFNAIINPPQAFILACGGLQDLVVPDKNEPNGFVYKLYRINVDSLTMFLRYKITL